MRFTVQGLSRLTVCAGMASLALLLSGCGSSSGPERAVMTGKVTLDDVPVEKGSIAFIPTGALSGPTTGAIIEKGEYKTTPDGGPILGPHRVEITAHRAGKTVTVPGAGGVTSGPSAGGSVETIEMYIPAKYNTKSELKVDVKAGTNTEDFKLTTK